jgi:4'-phosphopantetheinyl transferase
MPLERFYESPDAIWGFWKVVEDEKSLAAEIPMETVSETITSSFKRLEFLAGRALIQALLRKWDLPYPGLKKDSFGKPFLQNSLIQMSLSHSYPYVAAILHRTQNVGIDLEQPKDKLLKIAPRVLAADELADAGADVIKHCVYWCAKEALIKIYGRKGLKLSQNFLVGPFQLYKNGDLVGRILAKNTETAIPLAYHIYDNFVVAVSKG